LDATHARKLDVPLSTQTRDPRNRTDRFRPRTGKICEIQDQADEDRKG